MSARLSFGRELSKEDANIVVSSTKGVIGEGPKNKGCMWFKIEQKRKLKLLLGIKSLEEDSGVDERGVADVSESGGRADSEVEVAVCVILSWVCGGEADGMIQRIELFFFQIVYVKLVKPRFESIMDIVVSSG